MEFDGRLYFNESFDFLEDAAVADEAFFWTCKHLASGQRMPVGAAVAHGYSKTLGCEYTPQQLGTAQSTLSRQAKNVPDKYP